MLKIIYKTIIFKLIIILVIGISAINIMLVYLLNSGPLAEQKTLIIERGLNKNGIINRLADEGVIKYPLLLRIFTEIYGLKHSLKSGEYLFTSNITPLQVLQTLSNGKSIVRKIVIPEGVTVNYIIEKIKENSLLIGELNDNINEGFLLPETYFYSYNDQRQILVNIMKKSMSDALDEVMPKISSLSPVKTRLEVLTLASIIEKETNIDSEKPMVAAVFLNRLKKNMKLQADPTTIYAITLGKSTLGRKLTKSDLLTPSPYNTYFAYGLPPSPISCPGKKSIEAVIKPARTDALYFVANGLGGHHFSSTLKGHNKNVHQYKEFISNKAN